MEKPARIQRILVVEDDPIIASLITELLEDAAFEVDGPHSSLSDGVAAVAEHMPDGAVLDIRLAGHDVSLLADDLELYDIPFIFCSGAAPETYFGARFATHPFVAKDRSANELVAALTAELH